MKSPKTQYKKAYITSIPQDYCQAQIPGKLVLIDNLDGINRGDLNRHVMDVPSEMEMAVILICLEGGIDASVDHVDYHISQNERLTLLPGTVFKFLHFMPETTLIMMFVMPDIIDFSKHIKLGIEIGKQLKLKPKSVMPQAWVEEFICLYKMLKKRLQDPMFLFKKEIAHGIMTVFGYTAFNNIAMKQQFFEDKDSAKSSSRKEELLKRFIEEVQQHYKTERSITFYASELAVTPKYLSNVVYEVSGRHASEWISNFVTAECKSLLQTSGLTIKEICVSMNFANQSFFTKYFKQHTGMSPKEFRLTL